VSRAPSGWWTSVGLDGFTGRSPKGNRDEKRHGYRAGGPNAKGS
jgi:hypothetical protein